VFGTVYYVPKKRYPNHPAVVHCERSAETKETAPRPQRVVRILYTAIGKGRFTFTQAQLIAWFERCHVESVLSELNHIYGNVRVLKKSWTGHTLTITLEADTVEELKSAAEFVADPDDDGNEPIRAGGKEFLISGRIQGGG
jgi:hypothetical protein